MNSLAKAMTAGTNPLRIEYVINNGRPNELATVDLRQAREVLQRRVDPRKWIDFGPRRGKFCAELDVYGGDLMFIWFLPDDPGIKRAALNYAIGDYWQQSASVDRLSAELSVKSAQILGACDAIMAGRLAKSGLLDVMAAQIGDAYQEEKRRGRRLFPIRFLSRATSALGSIEVDGLSAEGLKTFHRVLAIYAGAPATILRT